MTRDEARGYLAAFIDGEGHIGCHVTKRGKVTKSIEFCNTDKQLLDRVIDIAASLDLRFHAYFSKQKNPKWAGRYTAHLRGGEQAMRHFQNTIPLQCERKIKALQELVESYCGPDHMEKIYASRRTSVSVVCAHCNGAFSAFPADLARGQGIYCSRKCSSRARTKKIEKNCETCHSTFLVYPARETTARFCSQRCSGLSRTDILRGQAQKAANARWHPT